MNLIDKHLFLSDGADVVSVNGGVDTSPALFSSGILGAAIR